MNTQAHPTEPSGEAVQRAAVGGAGHTPMAQVAESFVYFLRAQTDGSRWPVGTKLYAASPLIESATELLALAVRLEPWLAGHEFQEKARGERQHDSQFLLDLRAAIAKATGSAAT